MARCVCLVAILIYTEVNWYETANTSTLIEHTAERFLDVMQSGKTSFVYFGNEVNPTLELFLEQLEKSAGALEDYGILVVKVNCTKIKVPKFCANQKVIRKAYLFRGSDVLKSFDTDVVFDVNAIVAHVLFTLLFNEVKTVQTPPELLNVEQVAKGRADIVLAHIPQLGLPEHRAVMEAAFVYGAKHQFLLTTGISVLKHMGVEDLSFTQSRLWFLHCKEVLRRSDPCHNTVLRRPLTTLNIYTFLQLMEAPLVTEASVDPSEVKMVHSHLHTPLLFLFTQADTLVLDRVTAHTLAERLRGEVGLVLIHRDNPNVRTPLEYNAAYRLPGEGSTEKYFTLNNIEEVVSLFRENAIQVEEEEEEEEEDEDEDLPALGVLDDEVSESVYRDRGLQLDLELVLDLTVDTFNSAVEETGLVVVLFFVRWDAVSMAFMQSYAEVAGILEDVENVQLARVDCGEWMDVCSHQLISAFPTVRLHRPGEPPQTFRGMLGTENLRRFIMLSGVSAPVLLSSEEEVRSFLDSELQHRPSALTPVRVLGLFTTYQDEGKDLFGQAARFLRGETILGLYADQQAEQWAEDYTVELPAMLISRGPGSIIEPHALKLSTAEELVIDIQRAVLDRFPELTVENLPLYLELRKPLLLLFLGDEEEEEENGMSVDNEAIRRELNSLLDTSQLDPYLTCWIHLGRTPVGRAVLESYVGSVPQLPALVLSQLGSVGEVFLFPPEQALVSGAILQWLHRVEGNEELPAGLISDEKWGPPVPFYDFLSVMDQMAPDFATQRSPNLKRIKREEQGSGEEGSPGSTTPPTDEEPWPPREAPAPHPHSEL